LPANANTSAGRALPSSTFGAKPFLLAFGHYSDEEIDFIAQHYSLVVMGPGYTADLDKLRRLKVDNPHLLILDYAGPNIMRSYFPDWKFVNQHEPMFVHSANPASPVATRLGDGVLLTWSRDGRDGVSVAGYAVYRGTSPGSVDERLQPALVADPQLVDKQAAPGSTYWYTIKTVDGGGQQYDYSQPFSVDTSGSPPSLAMTSARNQVTPNGGPITFQASCSGTNAQVWVYADANRDHIFTEPGEKIAMTRVSADSSVFTASLPAPDRGGIPHYYECTDGTHTERLPLDGAYVTNPNNRLHNPRQDSDYWIMNSQDPGWRSHFADMTLDEVDRLGYDGLLADTVTATVPWWATDSMPQGSPYYSDADWEAGTADVLRDLKARLGSRLLFHNGPTTDPPTYSEITDGVLNEDWAHPNWEDAYPSEGKWRSEIDDLQSVSNTYGRASLLVSGSSSSRPDQARMYSYASFLIGNRGKSLYGFMNDYLHLNFFPETALDVGMPTQNGATADAYFDAASGVYSRSYSRALAVVNAGDLPRSVSLSGRYFEVQPVGGSVQQGGTLKFRETSGLSLPPHSGAVLFKNQPSPDR
jgi:hypothetical protein